jgi:hypothetical protein
LNETFSKDNEATNFKSLPYSHSIGITLMPSRSQSRFWKQKRKEMKSRISIANKAMIIFQLFFLFVILSFKISLNYRFEGPSPSPQDCSPPHFWFVRSIWTQSFPRKHFNRFLFVVILHQNSFLSMHVSVSQTLSVYVVLLFIAFVLLNIFL